MNHLWVMTAHWGTLSLHVSLSITVHCPSYSAQTCHRGQSWGPGNPAATPFSSALHSFLVHLSHTLPSLHSTCLTKLRSIFDPLYTWLRACLLFRPSSGSYVTLVQTQVLKTWLSYAFHPDLSSWLHPFSPHLARTNLSMFPLPQCQGLSPCRVGLSSFSTGILTLNVGCCRSLTQPVALQSACGHLICPAVVYFLLLPVTFL